MDYVAITAALFAVGAWLGHGLADAATVLCIVGFGVT